MHKQRRIHLDGFKMLDQKYIEKEATDKVKALERRIKRLEFEERRASKMSELAEKKASDLLHSRQRHYKDLLNAKEQQRLKYEELEM